MSIKQQRGLRYRTVFTLIGLIIVAGGCLKFLSQSVQAAGQARSEDIESTVDDETLEAAPPVTADPQDLTTLPQDTSALGGYNVLIADRGNNRLIEVTPEKKIVWEYQFNLSKPGLGADDAFFADGGKTVIVNLENNQTIELIDYQTKKVLWRYGSAGHPGSGPGMLHAPDDAYKLPNGDITVADIKNCRVIEIAPDKHIVRQYGVTGQCSNKAGRLNKPNGDTPLPNGHMLISNIVGRRLLELNSQWRPVFSMALPVRYPSDPQLMRSGDILISDYSSPGHIVELTRQGRVVWQDDGGPLRKFNRPSLAIELPNGNILANDDFNHRVIVIEKRTKRIMWQYGVTGKPGSGYGQLNVPDGLDIIQRHITLTPVTADQKSVNQPVTPHASLPVYSVGRVSRHPEDFVGRPVRIQGYVAKSQGSMMIISDESNGAIGYYDLWVRGSGSGTLSATRKYIFEGVFVAGGLRPGGNPYHLELGSPPMTSQR